MLTKKKKKIGLLAAMSAMEIEMATVAVAVAVEVGAVRKTGKTIR
jgi:hypothetical protein